MRVTITTIATADIEEEWHVEMTQEQYEAVLEEPYAFLDLLATEEVEVIEVTDKTTGNEQDREVTDIVVDPT